MKKTATILLAALLAWISHHPSTAAADPSELGPMLFMLEHMAQDYPKVVRNGRVTDAAEYAEQQSFARHIREAIPTLPINEEHSRLAGEAAALARAIDAKAPATRVLPRIERLVQALQAASGTAASESVDTGRNEAEPPLAYANRALEESLARYRAQDPRAAFRWAGAAYLEGFEHVEQALAVAAPTLKAEIEHGMADVRRRINRDAPLTDVETAIAGLIGRLEEARKVLDTTSLNPAMAFGAAFLILLREGLEAILVVAAIMAFLSRSGRGGALRYVHGGWIAALGAGVLTWAVAAYAIDISGAARELTEGVVALIAAAMLFYVGFWLHDKAHVERWQTYIHNKLRGAVGPRALWLLSGVAFVAVYREVFETILFYQALWLQTANTGRSMVMAGFGAAAVALVLLAWAVLRLSARLPMALFFRANAVLLFLLAVVFAGKGVAALQEAGSLPVDSIALLPAIEPLGVYPTLESLAVQLVLLLGALLVWFRPRGKLQVAGGK